MSEAPEFPQADPAIKYIVEQVSKIENQYACNAGYHRDHKRVMQRLANIDNILSETKKLFLDIQAEMKNVESNKATIQDSVIKLDQMFDKNNQALEDQLKRNLKGSVNQVDMAFTVLNATVIHSKDIINEIQKIKKEFSYVLEHSSDTIAKTQEKMARKQFIRFAVFTLIFGIIMFVLGYGVHP